MYNANVQFIGGGCYSPYNNYYRDPYWCLRCYQLPNYYRPTYGLHYPYNYYY